MDDHDNADRLRPRIVDTSGPEYSSKRHSKRRRHRRSNDNRQQGHNGSTQQGSQRQWPLEAAPIQRAVLEYGRRTAALGAQQGAVALRALAAQIRLFDASTPALVQIALNAEAEASRLRSLLDEVYKEDD